MLYTLTLFSISFEVCVCLLTHLKESQTAPLRSASLFLRGTCAENQSLYYNKMIKMGSPRLNIYRHNHVIAVRYKICRILSAEFSKEIVEGEFPGS